MGPSKYNLGTQGTGYTGDIAVDDLDIKLTGCETTTVATTLVPTPTPTYPPSPYDCDFQAGWCSWQQDSTGTTSALLTNAYTAVTPSCMLLHFIDILTKAGIQ